MEIFTSHILNAKNIDIKRDQLLDQAHVVVEVVLLLGVLSGKLVSKP